MNICNQIFGGQKPEVEEVINDEMKMIYIYIYIYSVCVLLEDTSIKKCYDLCWTKSKWGTASKVYQKNSSFANRKLGYQTFMFHCSVNHD